MREMDMGRLIPVIQAAITMAAAGALSAALVIYMFEANQSLKAIGLELNGE